MRTASSEVSEQLLVLPSRIYSCGRQGLSARTKERRRASRSDEARKRFIERGLAGRVKRVVRELVDYRVRDVDGISSETRREKRIVEPAERAECVGRSKRYIVSVFVELLCCPPCRVEIEVALVRHASDDRKPPRVRLERVAICRRSTSTSVSLSSCENVVKLSFVRSQMESRAYVRAASTMASLRRTDGSTVLSKPVRRLDAGGKESSLLPTRRGSDSSQWA